MTLPISLLFMQTLIACPRHRTLTELFLLDVFLGTYIVHDGSLGHFDCEHLFVRLDDMFDPLVHEAPSFIRLLLEPLDGVDLLTKVFHFLIDPPTCDETNHESYC